MKPNLFLAAVVCVTATLSVPNFAAKPGDQDQSAAARVVKKIDRQTATQILEDIRLLDAALDQWAIENNKQAGAVATPQELSVYLKRGTRMHTELSAGNLNDVIGNPMILRGVDSAPLISEKTFDQFSTVVKPEFWGPFYEGAARGKLLVPEAAPAKPAAPENPVTKDEVRNCAVRLLEEMRLIDAAIDMWAIEKNKQAGAQPSHQDLLPYIKAGTRLHRELSAGQLNDLLGNPITIPPVDTVPVVNKATAEKLAPVADEAFWGPYFRK